MELEPAVQSTLDRQVTSQKVAGVPIAYGDAEAVAEVVFSVPRHVHAMPTSFGYARSFVEFDGCAHVSDDRS
jgi:hypothetical protein